MAISLTRLKQSAAKKASSQRIAKEYAKQQKKQSGRKKWSGLLGGVGGKLLGGAIAGGLGIASGGLLMPLIMGASATMSKQLVDKASKEMGYGAQLGKLKGDKYGYGREEATTLREGLEEGMKTEDWKKSLGKDIAMAGISAGMSGKLGGAKEALKGGKEGGGWAQALGVGEKYGTGTKGVEGMMSGLGETIGLGSTFGGEDEVATDAITDKLTDDTSIYDEIGESMTEDEYYYGVSEELPEFQQGGLVQAQAPTIADYFGMQGVSLGGSSQKSIGQMLGMR